LATTNRLKRLERRRRGSDVATADEQGELARMRAKPKQTPEFLPMARELLALGDELALNC